MSNYPQSDGQPDFFTAFNEPESAANTAYRPVYPYNHVTQTPGGHSFELDDTPSRERIRLQHRSGTFIEMHPNGDEVHKVYGNGFEITIQNKNMYVKGMLKIEVEGDCEIHVMGDLIEQVEGNVEQHIMGNYTQVVEGISSITSQGDMNIAAGGFLTGGLKLQTGGYMHLSGDLHVDGELVAQKITSETRVDALTGMSAGFLGFVTELGGVSVGIPAAVPGNILCVGTVDAGVAVASPLGVFGLCDSFLSMDVVNVLLHNIHVHPATPVTGPPIPWEL